ncbi:CSL4 [Candida oxycetoniae]|uniref:CSL4 n=1 Tax=Candida oxycetoniae TaxID=497107 RepID=A0AAI9T0S3_9ASCO|nr:CSL4 [Candida oxycetoniae]KAI3406335.2 CSL4 [Candida oxycetoniae]
MESKVVVPGQYIVPAYRLEDNIQVKYVSGRGTIVNQIQDRESSKFIPIICATIVGRTYIKQLPKREVATDNAEVDSAQKQQDVVEEKEKEEEEEEGGGGENNDTPTFIVYVVPKDQPVPNEPQQFEPDQGSNCISINLPKENDIVLVRITRISQKQAWCELIAVENKYKQVNILSDSGIGSNGATAHASIPPGGGSQHMFNPQTIATSAQVQAQIYDLGENFKGIIRSQDIRSTERDRVVVGEYFKPGDMVRAMIISLGDGSNYYLTTARNDLGVVFAKSEGGAGSLMYPIDWQHMLDPDTGLVEKRKNANPFV